MQKNIMLREKDKFLSKQKYVPSIFKKHFGSITDFLSLFSWPEVTSTSSEKTQSTPLLKFYLLPKYKSNKEKIQN